MGDVLAIVLVRQSGREHNTLSHRQKAEGRAVMRQYRPVMSGKRLKSGPVGLGHSLRGETAQNGRIASRYVGGFSSLASQPSTSEAMGSLDTATVSTRPHFWHSNVR